MKLPDQFYGLLKFPILIISIIAGLAWLGVDANKVSEIGLGGVKFFEQVSSVNDELTDKISNLSLRIGVLEKAIQQTASSSGTPAFNLQQAELEVATTEDQQTVPKSVTILQSALADGGVSST